MKQYVKFHVLFNMKNRVVSLDLLFNKYIVILICYGAWPAVIQRAKPR